MIPEQEVTRLYLAAINATALGNCGRVITGLSYLKSGQQRISELSPREHPWADQLESAWRRVVDGYCAQFSIQTQDVEQMAPGTTYPEL